MCRPEPVHYFEPDCGDLLAGESVRVVAESAIRSGARYDHVRGLSLCPRAQALSEQAFEMAQLHPAEAFQVEDGGVRADLSSLVGRRRSFSVCCNVQRSGRSLGRAETDGIF